LDWAVFGAADGATHASLWTATSGGLTVGVSEQNAFGLRRANNFSSLFDGTQWHLATDVPSPGFYFGGHFDAPPDTIGTGSAVTPGTPGDHLMGLIGNASQTGVMTMNLTSTFNVQNLGFRLSTTSTAAFSTEIQVWSGANGTGTLLTDYLSGTFAQGGGTCAALAITVSNPPAPCNDAPFVAFLNYAHIGSLVITTNDVDGFYLGNLRYSTDVLTPEPTPLIFCGCGLVLLIVGKKRWSR